MPDSKKSQFSELEEEMLAVWAKEKTFEKSLKQREGQEQFTFYDGPPFANGLPHFGHSLVTSIKDSVLRYKTMRGYYVPRRNGWDCHGLPVEFAIEKEFGVSGKKQILELGLEKFNAACRASIFSYKDDWEQLLQRLGRWSDYDNYYATVDKSYTESVWWALGQINDKGLLYKGYKSTPYCPRCETPLSNFEVNDGYKDNVPDPSLYVKFRLYDDRDMDSEDLIEANPMDDDYDEKYDKRIKKIKNQSQDEPKTYLLAWTTTPWSLPGNAAIAVHPKEKYVHVRLKNEEGKEEILVLAQKRLEVLDNKDYQIVKEETGMDMSGLSYHPLFDIEETKQHEHKENLYQIYPADFVSVEEGTGVLHVAPAFGEDDLNLGQRYKIPVLLTIDRSGKINDSIGLDSIKGNFFKSADKPIIEHLTKEGSVFAAETFTHTYPFCWRCETPLLYYAINSWFIKVSEIRPELLKTAEKINWTPEHIKQGRFGKWLEGAKDWAISRNRYWGAPMPIWVNEDDESDYIVVKNIQELKELAGLKADIEDLHRPFIDDITFEKDGKRYKRVEEVLDCWFESGCMSFAQNHYPFENKELFKKSFPADFITEGLDQTRLWFYVQHVVNTILFDSPAYKNVVVNGMIMAADGQKLSKRLKNYPPLEDVFEDEGADSLRLFLLSSSQATQTADYMRFDRAAMKDLNRNVLGTLQNSFRFFKMYADIDKWQPPKDGKIGKRSNVLDEWIIARLNQTIKESTDKADNYKIAHAIQPIFELIDDTSNWFIRRSRRRFWKSEDDADKQAAYETLWFVLTHICQLLAPWAPFISDKLYRELINGTDLPESVHLSDWPAAGEVKKTSIESMSRVRAIVEHGLGLRMFSSDIQDAVKVRQPLASLSYTGLKIDRQYEEIISDEVNVKKINHSHPEDKTFTVSIDKRVTPELEAEGAMRELVRCIQNARKKAGLDVENRIVLSVKSDNSNLNNTVKTFSNTINSETLATELNHNPADSSYQETVNVNGAEVIIGITKA